ncbi:MAG: septal ring lytic transglycosylase RlpA family protein [Desulfuromonadaceae bacterium]|nr:septal ring lytic transglycosylase RlpA family protein [Desulfuromonadaceae bacterium]
MNRLFSSMITLVAVIVILFQTASVTQADPGTSAVATPQQESARSTTDLLEELLLQSSTYESVEGFASYYARRFEGHRTTSGHRYNPDNMTAAHESLPLGTVVRVVNPANKQEVHVTITDRCAPKSFHFIDLSRAAAKKIGLWGKGKIRVVIIPLLEEKLEKPV